MANQADRRSLLEVPSRTRGSVRSTHTDIFSDEFALEPYESLDGRHESLLNRDDSNDGFSNSAPSRRSSYRQQSFDSRTRRSRGSQRSEAATSIAPTIGDHASRVSHPPRSVASVSDLGSSVQGQQLSIRRISTPEFSRAQSPYQGAVGPSHPYAMYPQDIGLVRTSSIATTSTIRQPERSYVGPNGPTQPYGMYPQNTVPEAEPLSVAGFPGMDQDYQRRLGPDGEDIDDLIGPDGYAEQLPPYTRFASGKPPKYTSRMGSVRRSGVPPNYASETGSRRSAVPTILGDSEEVLDSPRHGLNSPRDNATSTNPFGDSSTELNSASTLAVPPKEEGGGFKERVREESRRRVRICCGVVPCWLLLVMIMAVILAVILGGAIGGMIAHKHIKEATEYHRPAAQTVTASASSAAPVATVTATIMPSPPDAIPLASTPANLPAIPTGTFAVSLNNAVTDTNSCLTNNTQSCAWDCATGAELSLVVSMASSNMPVVSLSYATPNDNYIRYGSQPPQLSRPANLVLMRDRDNFDKGPAYMFQQLYDKLVIVHEDDLPGGISSSKRSFLKRWFSDRGLENRGSLIRRQEWNQWTSDTLALPGDKPWLCYWNSTILEGFIFVTQDTSASASASDTYPSAAATSSGSSQFPGIHSKRQNSASPSSYPKAVRIEERRLLKSGQPYCQQMQILNNYQFGPLIDPATNIVYTIQLSETESQSLVQNQAMPGMGGVSAFSTIPSSPSGYPRKRGATNKRSTTSSSCQCGWMED